MVLRDKVMSGRIRPPPRTIPRLISTLLLWSLPRPQRSLGLQFSQIHRRDFLLKEDCQYCVNIFGVELIASMSVI